MSKFILLLITLPFLFIGCTTESSSTTTLKNISVESISNITKEDLLHAINKVRSQQIDCNDGLGLVGKVQPLTWSNELYTAAYEHSNDLAKSDTFEHHGSGTQYDITGSNLNKKSSFVERINTNGYNNYIIIGENIAGGFSTINETMQAWLASTEHCSNIMNSEFKEMGTAIIINPESHFKAYWTNNFGAKI